MISEGLRTCPGTDPPPSALLRSKRGELCLQNQRHGSGGHAHSQPAGGEVRQVSVKGSAVPERALESSSLSQAAFKDSRDQVF